MVVGYERQVATVVDFLGRRCHPNEWILDAERERRKIVVGSKEIAGRSLSELRLLSRFGATIVRITRHDIEFVPRSADVLELGDALTAVGEPEDLERLAHFAGHRERAFDETDLMSLTVGIILGLLLGRVEFRLPPESVSLGIAGGPLLVGLILGHCGRIGPIAGHFPRASRMLLTEVGLVFFLAQAGIQAGSQFVAVIRQHGWQLSLAAIVITLVPLAVGQLVARRALRLDLLQSLGGICGGMTSTPGLGLITANTDSNVPVVSYAAAYPVAMIFITIITPLLTAALS